MTHLLYLVGLPASGKSTYAAKISKTYNAIILSTDELRKEMFGDIGEQNRNTELFTELHKRAKDNLINGKNVVIDATNINYKKRMAFLNDLKGVDCLNICIFIATSYEECLKRNASRERKVPEEVITKMYKNFYVPQYFEGWDDIMVKLDYDKDKYIYRDFIRKLDKVNQDSPYHTLTIGKHCLKCAEYFYDKNDLSKYPLYYAAIFHDFGKLFTKTFKNSKGETTDIAHYYNHEFVSAYESMFYIHRNILMTNKEALQIAKYIQWHMIPFNFTEKSKTKYEKLLGKDFIDNLLILHEADKLAK